MRVPSPLARLAAQLERSRSAFAAAAFGVGALPWLPTLTFSFAYDDAWTVVRNAALRRPLGTLLRASLSGVGTRDIPDVSRPVMVASNWMDLHLWSLSPAGHHLSSVLAHGLLAVAAALVAHGLLGRAVPALAATALFALAPGHAEAVSSINYREDLLAALGVYAALAVVMRPARGPWRPWAELGAALAFLLALLSKESALALVPMLALLSLAHPSPWRWAARRERVLLALTAVVLAWSQWRFGLALAGDGVARAVGVTAGENFLRLGRYLGWSLVTGAGVPATSPVHDTGGAPAWTHALLPAGLGVLLACRGWWRHARAWRRQRRTVAAAALWLGGALGSCPLLGASNELADRYLVMGSLGVAVLAVLGLREVGHVQPRLATALGAGLVLLWGGLSARDALAWRNDFTLWHAATERTPGSPRAWVGLAWAHRSAGDTARAREALDLAVARDPDYAPAWVSRAYVNLLENAPDEARRSLARAEHLRGHAVPGFQRAKACLEMEPAARLACARGESPAAAVEARP